jgi:hypothetical protein
MPNRKRSPPGTRRRALELLAGSRDGVPEALMLAHGFSIELLVELVRAGPSAQACRRNQNNENCLYELALRVPSFILRVKNLGGIFCALAPLPVSSSVCNEGVVSQSVGLTSHKSSCNCTGCLMRRAGICINCAEKIAALILQSGPEELVVEPCSGACRGAMRKSW